MAFLLPLKKRAFKINPMKNEKTVIVIGAGVSGMTAGIYLLKHGYKVILLEKNPSVGGLCTGWYRKGRYIDGCIHWLSGTKENHLCYDIWKTIGAFSSQDDLIYIDTWGSFTYEGKTVRFLRDYKKAEQEWLEIAPEDSKEIKRFFRMVKAFTEVYLPVDRPASMLPLNDLMHLVASVLIHPSYLTTMKMNLDQYAMRFKNPAIRWAMQHSQPGPGNLFCMIFSYATVAGNSGAVPIGGSKPFVERIKNRYLDLGGELILNADVRKINIEMCNVVSVTLKNGTTIPCDRLVSAIDPNYTLDVLLNNQYILKPIQKRKKDYIKYPTISSVLVTYEVEDMKLYAANSFPVEPFMVAGKPIDYMGIRSYSYDPLTFVKDNKTVCHTLIDQFDGDYAYWERLYQDKVAYRLEKERIANEVIKRIVKQYPEYEGKINILDVFTPVTLNRYTNVTRGAYMGLFTENQNRLTIDGRIAGINNLFLASQWLEGPGGLPFAVQTGKYSAIRICKLDKIKFDYKNNTSLYKRVETF